MDDTPPPEVFEAVWLFGDPSLARQAFERLEDRWKTLANAQRDTGAVITRLWVDGHCHGLAMGWWNTSRAFGVPALSLLAPEFPGLAFLHAEVLVRINEVPSVTWSRFPGSEGYICQARTEPLGDRAWRQGIAAVDHLLEVLHAQAWAQRSALVRTPLPPSGPDFVHHLVKNTASGQDLAALFSASLSSGTQEENKALVAAWWVAMEHAVLNGPVAFGQQAPFPFSPESRLRSARPLLEAMPLEHRDLPRLARLVEAVAPQHIEVLQAWAEPEAVWKALGADLELVVPRGKGHRKEVQALFFQLPAAEQRAALTLAWDHAQQFFEGSDSWPAQGVNRVDFDFLHDAFQRHPSWPWWGELLEKIAGKMALPPVTGALLSTLRSRELDLRLPAPARKFGPAARF